MPTAFEDALAESVAEMRGLLKSSDPRDKVWAARTLSYMDANYKRVQLMEARTNAYIERCQTLNNRTSRLPPPTNRNSSAPSAYSAVNTPDSPPQSDDAHLIELAPNATLKEIIIETLAPGPKSRADYQRAFNAAVQQNADLHAEHQAMRAELNVFRSERLGSITLEKREELLAMRYETNKRRREHQPIPFFIKDLTPDELTQLNNRTPNQPEIPDAGHPRTHDFDQPPTNSTPPPVSNPNPRPAIPPCPSVNSVVKCSVSLTQASSPKPQDSPAVPPCPSVNSVVKCSVSLPQAASPKPQAALPPGFIRDPHGNILSPRAAARRADPNRYIFKPKKLTHPTPITHKRPNSS